MSPPVTRNLFPKTWRGAEGLAEDVRYYGKWMRDEAEKRIGHLYPKVKVTKEMVEGGQVTENRLQPDGTLSPVTYDLSPRPDLKPYVGQELTVIAWLWARTVASPNPAVGGAHVPLVRSFWLSTKPTQEAWIEPVIDRSNNTYRFAVRIGAPPEGIEPRRGTVARTGGTCLLSSAHIPFDHIRAEGKAGRMQAKLIAVVAEGPRGRVYLESTMDQEDAARLAVSEFGSAPDTDLPEQALSFRVQLYGMDKHRKLFSARQLTMLLALSSLIPLVHEEVLEACASARVMPEDNRPVSEGGSGARAYADAIVTYLAFAVDKSSEGCTTLCTWSPLPTKLHVVSTFGRQALPMIWDYAEANPFAESSGNFERMTELVSKVLDRQSLACAPGCVRQLDAASAPMADSMLISTDPPYYDNVGYADLSDFFYVWLRRSLSFVYPSLLSTVLTPKTQELIATPFRHGNSSQAARNFFEDGLQRCFESARRASTGENPLTIFYAFKQTENDDEDDTEGMSVAVASTGWQTILEAIIRAGFLIDGTWPMRTERAGGFRNKGQNALASSIVLSCRPRMPDAPLATRREFLTSLKQELPDALKHLQRGSIAPVDLAQAAIGPGMAVFTQYAKVMEADGTPMTVRQALTLINQALDEVLAEQEGEFDTDTRWALAWFEQFGMEEAPFGVAETLSKAKNTAVNALVEAGVVKARSGKVRLLQRSELPADWDPAADRRLTVWEITQHLIRMLEGSGEAAAAALVRKLGGTAEVARDLAYRLYTICERKKWADEALAYNGLVIAWPEITKLARTATKGPRETQTEMF